MLLLDSLMAPPLGVVPVLINPIAVLLAVLPGIFMALLSLLKPRSIKAGVIMLWRIKLQLILLAAVIVGVRFGVRALWPSSGAKAGVAEQADTEWPMFRGNVHRRGWVRDGSGDPVGGGINWTFREDNKQSFLASPAVRGNRVYIPSVTIGVFGGLKGSIYCLDADTGAVVWRGGPSDFRGSFSSPVVKDDVLVVGEGLHITTDARAVCMDISDETNPTVRWTFRTNSHIEGTPVIEDGRVFFTAGDDGIYAVDVESGEQIWHLPGEDFHDPETSILAHDGKVYIGLGFGVNGQAMVQVDAQSGEVLHRVPTPYPVFGAPAIYEDTLLFGMGNGDFVFPAEERVDYVLGILEKQGLSGADLENRRAQLGPGGAVWALDTETMETVWEYSTENTVLSAATVTGAGVFVATRRGQILRLDHQGNEIVSRELGEPVMSSMSVTDSHVVLMTAGGTVFVLRADDLSMVWEFALGTGTMNFSSPAVARGQIFVGSETMGVVSLGEPANADEVRVWRQAGGGHADEVPLPSFGAYERHWPEAAGGSEGKVLLSLAPLLIGEDRVVIFDAPEPRVEIGGGDGKRIVPLSAPASAAAAVGDVLAVAVGGETPAVEFLECSTGTSLDRLPLDPGIAPLLQATADGFWVQTREGLLHRNAQGSERSVIPGAAFSFVPEIRGNHLVGLRNQGHELAVLDVPGGKILWARELPAPATGSPVTRGTRILLPTAKGVQAFDLITGKPEPHWEAPGDSASEQLMVDRSLLVTVTAGGELLLLDADNGRELARHPNAVPDSKPLVDRDRIFWAGGEAVYVIDREQLQAPPQVWVDTSWIGRPTTSLLMMKGSLWIGMTDWGLVNFGERR